MRGRIGAGFQSLSFALLTLPSLAVVAPQPALANDKAYELARQFAIEAEERAAAAKAAAAAAEARKRSAVEANRQAEARRIAARKKAAEAERQAAQFKADEKEMLARARAELEQLRAEEADADRIARQAAEDLKRAEEERLRAAGEAEVRAEAEARARVAAEQKAAEAAAEEKAAAERARGEADRGPATRTTQQGDGPPRGATGEARRGEPDKVAGDPVPPEADSEARSRRLAEKLARKRAERIPAEVAEPKPQQGDTVTAARPSQALPGRYTLGAATSPPPAAPEASRVTVLLVMSPGHGGIRQFAPTADPVLCVHDTCYISQGAGLDARPMPRHRAFGTINTLGPRAGACNHRVVCVFRNVDLVGAASEIQPIDLRLLRHDRRQASAASPDATCRLVDRRLICGRPVIAPDYRAWIVPETLAVAAGSDALEMALSAGLREGGG